MDDTVQKVVSNSSKERVTLVTQFLLFKRSSVPYWTSVWFGRKLWLFLTLYDKTHTHFYFSYLVEND